jgi:DNA-binding response OmpR family regulator
MKRVLLVDDDPVAVRIYRDGLIRHGFEVSTAPDGLAALKALRANKPDLMVLDLMMPKLSGVEVLKFMRREKELETLPVIVLSNAYLDPLAQGAAVLGAQKGLLKVQCNPASLAQAIHEVLEGQPASENPDQLLAALESQAPPSAPTADPTTRLTPRPVTPTPPAQPERAPEVARSSTETKDSVRQELLNGAPAISRNLNQLWQNFQAASEPRDRELRFHDFFRKAHFVTTMAGMAEFHALAQMASAFEALLFGMMDDLPRLEPSLERTTTMAVEFMRELLAQAHEFSASAQQEAWALVVDDDRLSNRRVISALRNAQLQAQSTESPETALQWLQEKQYDLVLLDVEMPGLDGVELCERLRRLPGYEKTPVIYVTIHADLDTRARTVLSGGNDFISKPVRPVELAVKAVMHLLASRAPGS